MPTYEYKCSNCDAIVERWQRFSDAPLTECPACGGDLRRVIQAVGVVFKGSGWYVNDSRPKAPSEKQSSEAKPAAAASAA